MKFSPVDIIWQLELLAIIVHYTCYNWEGNYIMHEIWRRDLISKKERALKADLLLLFLAQPSTD
jgi:nitric oxide synthase oxygenase domain/subunit